jgi:hypothetical protein
VAAGEIRAGLDPRAEAAMILASLRGMATLLVTHPGNPDFARAAAALAPALERGLRA